MNRTIFAWLCLFLVLGNVNTSRAYRTGQDQASTADTDRVRWPGSVAPVYLYVEGAPGLAFSQVETALFAATSEWESPSCSSLRIEYRGTTTSLASGDGINTIVWHESGWAVSGFPDGAAGFTDLTYSRDANGDWVIVEADIHLNGEAFAWTTGLVSLPESYRSADVVLVHELGHLIGLLHPCGDPDAPLCESDPAFASTTMFPLYTGPGQATLDSDDLAAVCFLYPGSPCPAGW